MLHPDEGLEAINLDVKVVAQHAWVFDLAVMRKLNNGIHPK